MPDPDPQIAKLEPDTTLPPEPITLVADGSGAAQSSRARIVNLIVQVVGFAGAIALLLWCASIAFGEENRSNLTKLRGASPTQFALVLGIAFVSLTLSGTVFRETLRPVRALRLSDMLAINAIASFLAYLPFKISLLVRVAFHTRRDRVPLVMIGAWFAAVAFVLLGTLGVLTACSLIHRRVDAVYVAMAVVTLAGGGVATVFAARRFSGASGLVGAREFVNRLTFGAARGVVASDRFAHVHAAVDMLSHPRMVFSTIAARVLDLLLQAARIMIVASILGLDVTAGDAFLVAATGFIIAIVSPSGPVGARDGGMVGVAKLLALQGADSFALVALVITASEAVAFGASAVLGFLWLGPTRLLTPRAEAR